MAEPISAIILAVGYTLLGTVAQRVWDAGLRAEERVKEERRRRLEKERRREALGRWWNVFPRSKTREWNRRQKNKPATSAEHEREIKELEKENEELKKRLKEVQSKLSSKDWPAELAAQC